MVRHKIGKKSRIRGGKRSAHTQKRVNGKFAGKPAAKTVWDNTKLALRVEKH